MGNLWLVLAIGCNIKPLNFTNHKFPVTTTEILLLHPWPNTPRQELISASPANYETTKLNKSMWGGVGQDHVSPLC